MFVQEPHVVDKPYSWPNLCASCSDYGSPGRRYFVDLGFDQEFHNDNLTIVGEGRVYLCNICARNFVQKIQALLDLKDTPLEELKLGTRRTDPLPIESEPAIDEDNGANVDSSESSESKPGALLSVLRIGEPTP